MPDRGTDRSEPALVPELLVADLDRSLGFWCDLCGFTVRYARRSGSRTCTPGART